MKKIKWTDVRLVLMIGVVIFLYSFSSKRNETRYLQKTEVRFKGENNLFITPETVDNLLIQNFNKVTSIRKDKLDLNRLEHILDSNEMIAKAEVFATIDGTLEAVVTQKTPVARVDDGERSYYIDYEGNQMPLSDNFAARVPLVSGEINTENKGKLTEVLRKIYDDDFLKKNITGIQILPTGSLIMTNRNYNYQILFGRTINVDKKFDNYKAFFQHAIKDTLIGNYKTINLKFTQQVVCTKY
ncbi:MULTISPECIES: cell division protein FtsQ/DivIB [Flavobacterium]|uniref:Cell division protein FtsQ n=1 Tax=Flavobacterium supellecticarium TaxID=2565924 RepID=A0A4V3W8H0_9FLAO|nr:cell division protein FtsQ [Flavobacterium supellecticarium]MPT33996.1 cell division protein FtsQ [Flavobacterium sp.]THF51210.1 cell division protein FtsQ [Flavobacterium supellecticarium]HRB70663.1 cell division protein FtsQ [Flavobacterium sp.]